MSCTMLGLVESGYEVSLTFYTPARASSLLRTAGRLVFSVLNNKGLDLRSLML